MMRSMFSGVSGLRVHQTKMDVIANNISNVNTVGFKSSRVTFNEVFSQTLSGASGANPQTQRGGTNPMQIGLGANVASIDMLMTTGAAQRTDNPYDVMIQGDGFFVASDDSGTYYTRAGAFRIDVAGNLTMPNGMKINGWKATEDRNNPGQTTIDKNTVAPIQITGPDVYAPPEATSFVNYEGNFNAVDGIKGIENSIGFFDTLGNKYTIDVRYTYNTTTKLWNTQMGNYIYPNGDKTKGVFIGEVAAGTLGTADGKLGSNPIKVTLNPVIQAGAPAAFKWSTATVSTLEFNTSGNIVQPGAAALTAGATGFQFSINIPTTAATNPFDPQAGFKDPISVNLSELTQFNATTDAAAVTKDGAKPGDLQGISIGPDGKVTGRYSNGKTKTLAQLVLAQFANAAGLEKTGNNLFVTTTNSGEAQIGDPQSGGTSLLGGVLEMSNVDLSNEFTEMITTQRGFQANSRVITTSDDMLQELVNLKR